jgi:hypothetical protein
MITLRKRNLTLLGTVAVVLFSLLAPASIIYGGIAEPGGACPTEVDLVFAPPPYLGTLTVTWTVVAQNSVVSFHTNNQRIEQVGPSLCALQAAPGNPVPFVEGVTQQQFQSTTAQDLMNICMGGVDTFFSLPDGQPCVSDVFFQIIGAHNLTFLDATTFTVDVIFMQVEPR